ncbi:MAG: ferrochelatase [Planctomycetales bacterium]|nr:ferrochelatase [Planctomycetales bacterium]
MDYDAILVISFGGPEGDDDVIPFLENVLRGKNVPRERMLEVAEHYYHFGGVSPINEQNRALIAALKTELEGHGPYLPVYWGNRNWHPLLRDTLREMKANGVKRALGFVTSAFSSYSGCRQYRENVEVAQADVGQDAPRIDKLRSFYNHPGFIEPVVERTQYALAQIPSERHASTQLIFTAHSIPTSMAESSPYVRQLEEAVRLVSDRFAGFSCDLVYQSRSGPPTQPWLEPDICDYLRENHQRFTDVVIIPIGFISDHMEVLFDLDTEAHAVCQQLGLGMQRAGTVGTHPRFIQMIAELIRERTEGAERLYLGDLGPSHDVCPADCCPAPRRPPHTRSIAP